MDLQKLKKDLMSKGIFVVASTNEITAGLAWSVEGIEKVPKLGEVLFYKVNGVEYGVKPKKGNKHDIHWYYDQLKTGMKGAKGYSAGLTQFLNVWIKKGELVIVFKGNKATASVTSAKRLSSQEKCDAIINGLKNGSINEDELFKTITKEYNLTPDCVAATRWLIKEWGQEDIKNNNEWPIRFRKLYELHGVKFLNKYLNDLLFDSRSELSGGSSESILDGLYKKFNENKATAASPRKYRPSIRERMDRDDAMLDPLEYPKNIRGTIKKYNEFKKKVDGISILGIKPFRAYIDTSNYEDADGIIPVVYVDIKNGKIKINCVDNEKARLFDNLDSINSKYKFKVLDTSDYNTIAFNASTSRNELGRSDTFEVSEKDFDSFARDLKRECAIIENTLKVYSGVKVIASKEVKADSEGGDKYGVDAFIKDVNKLTINGKKVFKAEQRGDDIAINLLLKHFETTDMDKLNEIVEDKLEILFPITQKWMDADKGQTFGNRAKVGDIVLYTDEWSSQEFADHILIEDCSKIDWKDLPLELNSLYKTLKKDCDTLSGSNNFKVTADVCEVKETLGELNEENFEGINKEHDRLMYIKVTPEQFLQLWKTSPNFNGQQIQKIVYGFKLALRTLNSKFENKGILIECFYKKKDGKGYIRVEYDKDLYIIYVSRSEDNGEVKVITRKMRKVIPTKNFNILSTSVSSLAFERSNLPSGFKPIWEEVSK